MVGLVAKRKRRPTVPEQCPCGSETLYAACCGALHLGTRQPTAAVDVMRARYSAHVVGDHDYLLASWHPDTRPEMIGGRSEQWLGLELGEIVGGRALDTEGTVAFAAHFHSGEQTRVLRETSRFVRLAGRWIYYDGRLDF